MIPVNGKPIGSFLTIDCYHVGRTPKSVCSGWGEDMFQNQPRQQQKIIPQAINVQRYTYQCIVLGKVVRTQL
ncbi:hypothetical protein SPLC1_S490520 [Arthrospira platensis C1]|uniref:Uncharacterized protein n=1 Tax=Limnospira indica PCC 8005 TaxID=376219 RepID=A0A9P1KFQ8_9CYAN|nr:hypothetical protein SPLC1_S490520 [Arthrospira platensis C1]CDM95970.1 conserved protein of unknown function [Limnospira indica PCC 8005]